MTEKYPSDRDMIVRVPLAIALGLLILVGVATCNRRAHGQWGPPQCGPGGCGPAGCPSGVGVRAGWGNGIQAGVLGQYGGVAGVQVGPGPRVQAGVVPGPSRPAAINTRAICVIEIHEATGNIIAHQSGVLTGPDSVTTAWHGFAAPVRSVTCWFSGVPVPARVRCFSPEYDLLILDLDRQPGIQPIQFSQSLPPVGTQVTAYGYPNNGTVMPSQTQLYSSTGRVVGYASSQVGMQQLDIRTDCQVSSGMSGGPFVSGGLVVGIISAGNTGGSGAALGMLVSGQVGQSPGLITPGNEPPSENEMSHPLPVPVDANQAGISNAGEQGNGATPDLVAGQGPPAAVAGSPRPVVAVTRTEFDAAMAEIKDRDEQIVERLQAHSEAIASLKLTIDNGAVGPPGPPGPAGKDAAPADLSTVEARLTTLEAGLKQPVGFVDRYMRLDPNGDHEYMGRRYSLRDEQHETIALGQSRVTYYYPLDQSGGSVAPANPE